MKKKIIAIIAATSLLAGCGSQNLTPLEKKSSKLHDENHKLKSDIQNLNQQISSQNEKISALKKDKDNIKKAKSNKKKASYLKASSKYYDDITEVIRNYNNIEDDINKNKGDKKVQEKIETVTNDADKAYSNYSTSIDKDEMSSSDKSTDKSIKKLDKKLTNALGTIKDGYAVKDKKKIQKGQRSLSNVNINSN
ncbi:hypothetical protein ISO99_01715 [Staphylococcus sp. 18_1_E_LY]|uniref:Lipoprotein n=1 Tax=Staphylococcus lloydii TaxID=2781774 RepID=A0A7T1AY26_9STAP|nr:hypothetical protein [Staphylococcus lloydii]MBF7018614.1 hypothetical protein [Staphylococcus lloydii]MBF7026342.1 hypothetical protein [Staphylococcus lloydii]MDU9417769.1 hypothetical protein [Staphylococcus lloydii]QPM74016.1 hypothetical protein ISP08_06575 [Staphylococcus lloydii]